MFVCHVENVRMSVTFALWDNPPTHIRGHTIPHFSPLLYLIIGPIIARRAILCLCSICEGQLILYMLFPAKNGMSSTKRGGTRMCVRIASSTSLAEPNKP